MAITHWRITDCEHGDFADVLSNPLSDKKGSPCLFTIYKLQTETGSLKSAGGSF